LEFIEPDRLALRLDCNRATARWSATASGPTGGRLEISAGAMTRAACPPGSLDTRIAGDLEHIRS
jgi:META domain